MCSNYKKAKCKKDRFNSKDSISTHIQIGHHHYKSGSNGSSNTLEMSGTSPLHVEQNENPNCDVFDVLDMFSDDDDDDDDIDDTPSLPSSTNLGLSNHTKSKSTQKPSLQKGSQSVQEEQRKKKKKGKKTAKKYKSKIRMQREKEKEENISKAMKINTNPVITEILTVNGTPVAAVKRRKKRTVSHSHTGKYVEEREKTPPYMGSIQSIDRLRSQSVDSHHNTPHKPKLAMDIGPSLLILDGMISTLNINIMYKCVYIYRYQ